MADVSAVAAELSRTRRLPIRNMTPPELVSGINKKAAPHKIRKRIGVVDRRNRRMHSMSITDRISMSLFIMREWLYR
jgi:hypothetical protein